MKFTLARYSTILAAQAFFLAVDIAINTCSVIIRKQISVTLILFIIQDVCLIFALAALLITFFSTYVFQAGLVELLYDRFRTSIIICMIYFILTTVLLVWTLAIRWNDPFKHTWSVGLQIFYALQKSVAPIYYHYYKRAALRISDPRFYEELDWEQRPPCRE